MANIMLYLIIAGFLFFFLFVPLFGWYLFWEMSFKHRVWIARQTGKGVNDVIWFGDRAKVVVKDGVHIMRFRRQRVKTSSPQGKFWTKFYKPMGKKFTRDEWETENMTRKLQRGLFLYQTIEGEFHPMSISYDNARHSLKILSQDNRMFLMNQTIEVNELTLTKRQQIMAVTIVVAALIVLGVAFVLFLIYLNEAASAAIDKVPTPAIVDTVQGVVGG